MDQSGPNHQPGGAPQHAVPVGTFRQGNNPTMERSIISGDKVQFGRLRQHTRLSESQSSGAEEECLSNSMKASGSYGQSPNLHGMQAEGTLYNRSAFEKAEHNYQRWLASNGNGPLSSSPRSPNTRSYMTFQSRLGHGQQQDQGHPVTTVKASGTPHRRYSRGRNRTSSETEQGGRGSRGATQRKRGFSETESRPRWDNTKMSGLQCLASENIWFDKQRYDEAEKCFYEGANGPSSQERDVNAILQDIAKSRQNILQSLNGASTVLQMSCSAPNGICKISQTGGNQPIRVKERTFAPAGENSPAQRAPAETAAQKRKSSSSSFAAQAWKRCMAETASWSSSYAGDQELVTRMKSMELENHTLHTVVEEMRAALQKLESRVAQLEKSPAGVPCAKAAPVHAAQVKVENGDDDDDDDMDLFGSDDDDEEAERLKQERIDAYAAKKSKKPALIAKSSILLDVKPWDDETDMKKLEECVRSVQMDGLLWGASKLLPVGYGIKKLQINCVVEDDKVGTDILEEEITKFEDYIQSVDVAAFNKI